MRLTDTKCREAIIKEKSYRIFDGGGLYLEVMPTGSRLWRLKYRYQGLEKRISFGSYPDVTLAHARQKRDVARKQLKAGINPASLRRKINKNQLKPKSSRNIFNISISNEGVLTIETESRIIHLSVDQTETLRNFLEAVP